MMNSVTGTVLDQWTMVLGFIMPLLVSLVLQSHWRRPLKTTVAFASCLLAAAVQLLFQGKLDLTHFAFTSLSLFAQTIVFLKGFWGPLGVAGALESATTFTQSPTTGDSNANTTSAS